MSTPGGTGVIAGRRKLFVQDGYISGCVPTIGHGFRRTLVGLKFVWYRAEGREITGFRRTLVGLKSPCGDRDVRLVRVSDAPLWG